MDRTWIRRARGAAVAALALMLVLAVAGIAAAHGGPKPEKKGILLVAFGTSFDSAEVSYRDIEAKVNKAFPGVEVRWAYTSNIIRHKLAAEENKHVDSPAEALARMMDDGFTRVAVQSLHTIPGREYEGLKRTVEAFEGMPKGFVQVEMGTPLMYSPEDVLQVVDVMLKNAPKERKPGEALVFMGHGTEHPANIYYAGSQYFFWQKDPNVLVGTVEGTPTLDDVVAELKARGLKTAYLVPFMSVAGDHAHNDMAGDDSDSWKSVLEKAGVHCIPVMHGTAEIPDMANLWVEHLRAAFARLK